MNTKKEIAYPLRINKYLAYKNLCTRREADTLIAAGKVMINGRKAVLGDKVSETDQIKILFRTKKYRYFAYNKPRGIITHSPADDEKDIRQVTPLVGVFPIGRLDKDSHGLIILTDDGRVTDKLLNPDYDHEKEYLVMTRESLPNNFKDRMERGVNIEGYMTKPCKIRVMGDRRFVIELTEGKKHQIRRMCAALNLSIGDLQRTRIMNIRLEKLPSGAHREFKGSELATFLKSLGF
jgi:23S rRNA pseudouridine2604 synthase